MTEARVCEQLAQGCYLKAERPGVEPATFGVEVQRPDHYATRSHGPTARESRIFILFSCYEIGNPFSALTLLVGRQEGHPACKKLSGGVLAWLSVWSEVQICIWPS